VAERLRQSSRRPQAFDLHHFVEYGNHASANMKQSMNRRQFLGATAVAGAGVTARMYDGCTRGTWQSYKHL